MSIINNFSECTVNVFMDCAYKNKYKGLGEGTEEELKEAFETIYTQYIDTAQLYLTLEFEKLGYISSLDTRIRSIELFIQLQRIFIKDFNIPFLPALGRIKHYGHSLYWDKSAKDLEGFLRKLNSIESREKRYKEELNIKINELIQLRKKQVAKEMTIIETRKQFVQQLIRLEQNKFVISRSETTMEDIALMILDVKDRAHEERAARQRTNNNR